MRIAPVALRAPVEQLIWPSISGADAERFCRRTRSWGKAAIESCVCKPKQTFAPTEPCSTNSRNGQRDQNPGHRIRASVMRGRARTCGPSRSSAGSMRRSGTGRLPIRTTRAKTTWKPRTWPAAICSTIRRTIECRHVMLRQRLQRLFFPEGVAFSGKAFDRTVVTSSLFEYLRPLDAPNKIVVDQNIASWNQLSGWLREIAALREAA